MNRIIDKKNDFIIRKGKEVDTNKWDLLINTSTYSSPFQTKKILQFLKIGPDKGFYCQRRQFNIGRFILCRP